jgi:hypothetical protein
MLAARLVHAIEDHAEELTRGVLDDLGTNPRTPSYHALSRAELHRRVYEVYHHLGRWLDRTSEDVLESRYGSLGRRRREEGVPLEELVYALVLTKRHLRDYVLRSGFVQSVVDLYQEEDFNLRLDQFFEEAIYYAVRGYQHAAAGQPDSVAR